MSFFRLFVGEDLPASVELLLDIGHDAACGISMVCAGGGSARQAMLVVIWLARVKPARTAALFERCRDDHSAMRIRL